MPLSFLVKEADIFKHGCYSLVVMIQLEEFHAHLQWSIDKKKREEKVYQGGVK